MLVLKMYIKDTFDSVVDSYVANIRYSTNIHIYIYIYIYVYIYIYIYIYIYSWKSFYDFIPQSVNFIAVFPI